MKRIFDLLCSLFLIVLLSPLILTALILVRWKIGRPVIFKQLRPGLHGKPFYMYKLRTMTDELDDSGRLLPDESRLTALGKWLRKLSMDELLQLINVIKGDLSLVGPRPLLLEYMPLYTEDQLRRHDVLPGITGWAQVNGRNAISWEEKFKLDQWYVEHRSFRLDLKILLWTFLKVVHADGISNANHATMPQFEGSLTVHE